MPEQKKVFEDPKTQDKKTEAQTIGDLLGWNREPLTGVPLDFQDILGKKLYVYGLRKTEKGLAPSYVMQVKLKESDKEYGIVFSRGGGPLKNLGHIEQLILAGEASYPFTCMFVKVDDPDKSVSKTGYFYRLENPE